MLLQKQGSRILNVITELSLADFGSIGPNQMLSKDIPIALGRKRHVVLNSYGQKKTRAFYHFAFVLPNDTRSKALVGPLDIPLLTLSRV